jgi:hypothetical protein
MIFIVDQFDNLDGSGSDWSSEEGGGKGAGKKEDERVLHLVKSRISRIRYRGRSE